MKFRIKDARKLKVELPFRLADVDPTSTPGFSGDSEKLEKRFHKYDAELYDLQERLFANARVNGTDSPSILLVLQGMDTSGKGGMIRKVVEVFDPQGIRTHSFGPPTKEELRHDFLWRVRSYEPVPGEIVVFDRSHYEDVLIQRVEAMASAKEIERRYDSICHYERELAANGVVIIKVMLHISKDFQKENLIRRLEREDKWWKYDPSDIDNRRKWDEYQKAYEIAINRTHSDEHPWYVIPGDSKPYARMAVKYLLVDKLRQMNLEWPQPEFDLDTELKRLKASG